MRNNTRTNVHDKASASRLGACDREISAAKDFIQWKKKKEDPLGLGCHINTYKIKVFE